MHNGINTLVNKFEEQILEEASYINVSLDFPEGLRPYVSLDKTKLTAAFEKNMNKADRALETSRALFNKFSVQEVLEESRRRFIVDKQIFDEVIDEAFSINV